jgi:hypothetical protein
MNPLSFAQIQDLLNDLLGLILSERRTISITATALVRYTRQQQEWVFQWVRMFRHENMEMAYQFEFDAPKVLALMDEMARETFAIYD